MASTTTRSCLLLSFKTLVPFIFAVAEDDRRDAHFWPQQARRPHGAQHRIPKPNEISVFLYNFLDDAGVKPVRVLQKAGLRHSTQADCEVPDAVHALYIATQ
jgi:hypothetical protein